MTDRILHGPAARCHTELRIVVGKMTDSYVCGGKWRKSHELRPKTHVTWVVMKLLTKIITPNGQEQLNDSFTIMVH
jgi:hypothetical protein